MALVVLWICLCLLIAWLLQNRPMHGGALVIVLWSVVPSIAGHHLTGRTSGGLSFHPATWLVLALVLVQLLFHPQEMVQAVARHVYTFWIIIIFAVAAFLTSRVLLSGGARTLMDQIVGPAALFWLIIAFGYGQHHVLVMIRNVIITVVALQCILAVVQWQLNSIIFYQSDFANRYWFDPDRGFDRWFGTVDSPLVLSLLICVAAALTVGLKRSWLRFLVLTLYIVGSVITQSRTGTAVTGLVVLWTVLTARVKLWTRVLSLAAVGVAVYFIATSTLVQGLAQRLSNDTGSTSARLRALHFVADHWTRFIFTGDGLTSSYVLAQNAGLRTSIESSYLMYSIDVGFILATFYFGLQLTLLIRHGGHSGVPGVALGALVGCLLQHLSSGVAGANIAGTIIWTTLGLVVAGSSISQPALEEADEPAIAARPERLPVLTG